jgi:alpha-1,3-rhamnosyl/mannosyltransferase
VVGLVDGLLGLGREVEVVALGGADPGVLPPGVAHVAEGWHPPSNLGWTLIGLPRAAARAGVDLVHAPAYTAPFWSGVPVVVTVHDVSYELHPEWYPYRRDKARRAFYRWSARTATRILTVSAFSVSEISAAYGIPADRVTVTPLGVAPAFGADPAVPDRLPRGVSQPFLLHVGDLHARRNLALVVEAMLAARRRSPALRTLSLVLAGVDRGLGRALRAIAVAADAPDAVVQLGEIDERELRALYRGASALVYPSLYEGFGLPLIEAMASGTPVIASRAASIPEVVGDAGMLLDPRDVPAWTDAIAGVLGDPERQARMRVAGRARAAEFTWERTARLTLDVYHRALERRT